MKRHRSGVSCVHLPQQVEAEIISNKKNNTDSDNVNTL